jgi:hypothetical protein
MDREEIADNSFAARTRFCPKVLRKFLIWSNSLFFLGPETNILPYFTLLEVLFSNLALPSSATSNGVKWYIK